VRRLLILLAVAAAFVSSSAAAAVRGEQRLLIVLATWGPTPVTPEEARGVLTRASAFERAASYGTTWLSGDVVGWVGLPRTTACDLDAIERAGRSEARAAGLNPDSYNRLVFVFPQNDCPWGGAYFGGHVWANGYFTEELLAHELGHLFGTAEEGPAWLCDAGACHAENYASPYSVMGHGVGHYSAYEKWVYGWLRPTPARAGGPYTLDAFERYPSALRVLAASDEYWFEFRADEPGWNRARWLFQWDLQPTRGVVVHAGSNGLADGAGAFSSRNVYVPVNGKAALGTGETFAVAGAFTATVSSAEGDRAVVDLRWTDTTRPRAPRIVSVRPELTWTAARETGSGVASYEVRLDGRLVRTLPAVQDTGSLLLPATLRLRLPRAARGAHRVSVVAVDRAGNRSPAALRSFRVK
jgi:hypothetical protein